MTDIPRKIESYEDLAVYMIDHAHYLMNHFMRLELHTNQLFNRHHQILGKLQSIQEKHKEDQDILDVVKCATDFGLYCGFLKAILTEVDEKDSISFNRATKFIETLMPFVKGNKH